MTSNSSDNHENNFVWPKILTIMEQSFLGTVLNPQFCHYFSQAIVDPYFILYDIS